MPLCSGPLVHVAPDLPSTALQWIEAYPSANSYACPGLMAKQPQVTFTGEVGHGNHSPAEWLGEVESTFLSFERNPFNGKPFFNEVRWQAISIKSTPQVACTPHQ